jgi:hypothetical protein
MDSRVRGNDRGKSVQNLWENTFLKALYNKGFRKKTTLSAFIRIIFKNRRFTPQKWHFFD